MANDLSITSAEFESEVLQSNVPVLVDFWAVWCGPCKAIAPAVEEVAREYAGRAKVFKVDVDTEQELAMRYGIMSIPALLVFKNGQVVDQSIGLTSKEAIAAMLDRAIG